jgi:hypothetical protein
MCQIFCPDRGPKILQDQGPGGPAEHRFHGEVL